MNEKNEGYWDDDMIVDTSYALFFYIIPLQFIFWFLIIRQ